MTTTSQPLVSVIIPTYNRRDEVRECVESVLASSYPRLEVIVVDNASADGTKEDLVSRFGDSVRLIRSEINLYAGGGRNLGAKAAKGDYLLFVDSDNVVDGRMIEELVGGFGRSRADRIGLAGPFMYYHETPDRLCWVRGDINKLTSRTWWEGIGEKDEGQYAAMPFIRVGHIPNVFMLERSLFEAVGGIDPDYVMHYEESDLAEKVKRAGWGVALFPRARTRHKIPLAKRGDRQFSGANPGLLYYSVRNRILFMRKNAHGWRLWLFLVVFANAFLVYSLAYAVLGGCPRLWPLIIRGHMDGLSRRPGAASGFLASGACRREGKAAE